MANVERKLLIGIDGSAHALHAVDYVARNCSPLNTCVTLMSVQPPAPEEVFWQVNLDEEFKRSMKEKYDQVLARCRSEAMDVLQRSKSVLVSAGFSDSFVGIIGQPCREGIARDIIAESLKGYDAVIIGRRGLGKMESLLLGSVSNKIVQRVNTTPVWVIGGDIRSRNILLAVDGSDDAYKAVQYVAGFAVNTRAEVALCHIVRQMNLEVGPSLVPVHEELEEQLRQHALIQIQKMFNIYRECLAEAGMETDHMVTRCRFGSISRAADILMEAREGGYGTIVLGRRGISKVREFLIGRVTNKVLNGSEGLAVWIVP
jgi:nucleotide-binding universal stress UspA family protein